ncbi:MAG: tripartite tricarboxylate transporter permease [Candidatus Methanomethylophilaceae archaeon]|nr:tripartite tricarboxylate transporter permease [Candidatus Methanomethylophilaceae archaeon]
MDPDLLLLILYMCLIGAAAGTFSGLVPGIHVNTLAMLLLVASPYLLDVLSGFVPDGYGPLLLSCAVMSAAVVHSSIDFIPSAFIGIPDADTVLNVLPAHRMILNGEGMAAVRCAAIGSLTGAIVSLILTVPLYILLTGGLGDYLDSITVGALIVVLALMILDEVPGRRLIALIITILSAAAGLVVMLGVLPMSSMFDLEPETMFPLLTGLFGIPSLLTADRNSDIPPQKDDEKMPVSPVHGIKGVLTGSITGWFPGITSTAGATIAGHVFSTGGTRGFISMVSSIGTASTMFAFITLCINGKERSGTMSVIGSLLRDADLGLGSVTFVSMMVAMAIASVLAYMLTVWSGKAVCGFLRRMDMVVFNRIILVAMVAMTVLFCGYWGLIVLIACTLIGLLPILLGTRRIHLTGCLIVPVLLFKIGLF